VLDFVPTEWLNRFIALVISTHFKHLAVGVITIATAFATICPNDPTLAGRGLLISASGTRARRQKALMALWCET
jgi:hypothetical protein